VSFSIDFFLSWNVLFWIIGFVLTYSVIPCSFYKNYSGGGAAAAVEAAVEEEKEEEEEEANVGGGDLFGGGGGGGDY
jgi:hypothetical protein